MYLLRFCCVFCPTSWGASLQHAIGHVGPENFGPEKSEVSKKTQHTAYIHTYIYKNPRLIYIYLYIHIHIHIYIYNLHELSYDLYMKSVYDVAYQKYEIDKQKCFLKI